MSHLKSYHWQMLALLADGIPQHISKLSQDLGLKPHQMNGLWQQMPPHIRGLLRQQDGQWRLIHPLAIFNRENVIQIGHRYGFQTALMNECISSNDIVLETAKQSDRSAHRMLVIAHQQSKGRGRQGKDWHNQLGECLMFSFGWVFEKPQQELGPLALVVALGCVRAFSNLGIHVQIKWPNDLVVGQDKLGGILIETARSAGKTVAVIGIGINFVLPKEVKQATSIQALLSEDNLHCSVSIASLLDALLCELTKLLVVFEQQGFQSIKEDYEKANRDYQSTVCLLQHEQVLCKGKMTGVTESGALKLQTGNEEKYFVSGEISLRQPEQVKTMASVKPHRYLLLDAGNSQLKWVWVENGEIIHVNRAPYRDLAKLHLEWNELSLGNEKVIGCAVCGELKKNQVIEQIPVPIEWLTSMRYGLGIFNHYRNVAEHGADRWFNVLGSRRFSQHACVVVSCGTAVTIDALTHDNHYLGGSIMPGFHLMKESMALKTANLNRPLGRVYDFPTTTANAMASGMIDAVCGSILLMHERLQTKVGTDKKVDLVITGGGALKVAQALPNAFSLDNTVKIVDNLVIYGLLNWVEQA